MSTNTIPSGSMDDYINSDLDPITIDVSSLDYSSNNILTTGGSSISWTQPYDNFTIANSWTNDASVNIDTNGITVKEGGDIKIGNKSLMDAIAAIEDRLAILKPNPELEDKWEELKNLRRQYEALERDILEKEKLMKILKET